MFSDKEIKKIVNTFNKLSQIIYEANGLEDGERPEDRRAAEHCASRIIAAGIISDNCRIRG